MKSNIERFRATHAADIDPLLGPTTILELKSKGKFNLENYLTEMERKVNAITSSDRDTSNIRSK